MCVKWIFLFDSEMKVYYNTQVLEQCFNIKTMSPNYILEYCLCALVYLGSCWI